MNEGGDGARESGKRGANSGGSTEEIRRTSAEEKATLEIISIYLMLDARGHVVS